MDAHRVAVIASIAALAGGCISLNEQTPIASQSPATADVKSQIATSATDVHRDPASIRNAEISSIVPNPQGNGLLVCVRAEAKDRAGGYSGRRMRLVGLRPDRTMIPGSGIEGSPFCANPALKWQPFPEIHAYARS